jgi:heme/copper-type cytochrome/quinol oxidase subunit 2
MWIAIKVALAVIAAVFVLAVIAVTVYVAREFRHATRDDEK